MRSNSSGRRRPKSAFIGCPDEVMAIQGSPVRHHPGSRIPISSRTPSTPRRNPKEPSVNGSQVPLMKSNSKSLITLNKIEARDAEVASETFKGVQTSPDPSKETRRFSLAMITGNHRDVSSPSQESKATDSSRKISTQSEGAAVFSSSSRDFEEEKRRFSERDTHDDSPGVIRYQHLLHLCSRSLNLSLQKTPVAGSDGRATELKPTVRGDGRRQPALRLEIDLLRILLIIAAQFDVDLVHVAGEATRRLKQQRQPDTGFQAVPESQSAQEHPVRLERRR
jgi:hypothetical protein